MSLTAPEPGDAVASPDSDGLPMADNEWQERAILILKTGLRAFLADRPDVHVTGDLFWYPVEGHPEICAAPAVFVIGRRAAHPRSHRARGSAPRRCAAAPLRSR